MENELRGLGEIGWDISEDARRQAALQSPIDNQEPMAVGKTERSGSVSGCHASPLSGQKKTRNKE